MYLPEPFLDCYLSYSTLLLFKWHSLIQRFDFFLDKFAEFRLKWGEVSLPGCNSCPNHLPGLDVVTPALDASWISHQENPFRILVLPSTEWKHRWLLFCIYYKVNKLQLVNQELSKGSMFLLLWWCWESWKGTAFLCNKFNQYMTCCRWTQVQYRLWVLP